MDVAIGLTGEPADFRFDLAPVDRLPCLAAVLRMIDYSALHDVLPASHPTFVGTHKMDRLQFEILRYIHRFPNALEPRLLSGLCRSLCRAPFFGRRLPISRSNESGAYCQ